MNILSITIQQIKIAKTITLKFIWSKYHYYYTENLTTLNFFLLWFEYYFNFCHICDSHYRFDYRSMIHIKEEKNVISIQIPIIPILKYLIYKFQKHS